MLRKVTTRMRKVRQFKIKQIFLKKILKCKRKLKDKSLEGGF